MDCLSGNPIGGVFAPLANGILQCCYYEMQWSPFYVHTKWPSFTMLFYNLNFLNTQAYKIPLYHWLELQNKVLYDLLSYSAWKLERVEVEGTYVFYSVHMKLLALSLVSFYANWDRSSHSTYDILKLQSMVMRNFKD